MIKYLRLAGLAFAIFYVLTNPEGASHQVNQVLHGLTSAGAALSTFVNGIG